MKGNKTIFKRKTYATCVLHKEVDEVKVLKDELLAQGTQARHPVCSGARQTNQKTKGHKIRRTDIRRKELLAAEIR